MHDMVSFLAIAALVSILAGYLRLITDENGNIPLMSYRFTGCLGAFLFGMATGTRDLLYRKITSDALSSLMVYGGLAIFFVLFSQGSGK